MIARLVAPVAAFGFVASLVAQIGFLLGYNLLGPANAALFIGVFVVWFPTVMSVKRLQTRRNSSDWRALLVGAPPWALPAMYAVFAYAIINFLLGFLKVFSMEGDGFWRVGSSHAMVFYLAAWGTATAAIARAEQGLEWKCEQGHDMAYDAKFCPECGAPMRKPGRV